MLVDGVDGDNDSVGFDMFFRVSFFFDFVIDGLFGYAFDDERVFLVLVENHSLDGAAGDELGEVAVS